MSLVIVGSVALDDIQTPGGAVENSLGGSAVYAAIAASKFNQAKIVGVVGHDFSQDHIDVLNQAGVDISGLEKADGLTFKWKGKYTDLNKAETIDTQLNVFGDFDPKIPENYKDEPYLFLGNIHPALQLQVLDTMSNPKITACDTMNFWIERTPELLKDVIKKVNIIFINEDEIKMLTGKGNIFTAAEEVLEMGPQLVVVKRGEYGAVAVGKDSMFFMPVYPIRQVIDPTGAGDSFAGGFMGTLAQADRFDDDIIRQAMIHGTITASFNIQSFSVDSLASADLNQLQNRITELISYMKI